MKFKKAVPSALGLIKLKKGWGLSYPKIFKLKKTLSLQSEFPVQR